MTDRMKAIDGIGTCWTCGVENCTRKERLRDWNQGCIQWQEIKDKNHDTTKCDRD